MLCHGRRCLVWAMLQLCSSCGCGDCLARRSWRPSTLAVDMLDALDMASSAEASPPAIYEPEPGVARAARRSLQGREVKGLHLDPFRSLQDFGRTLGLSRGRRPRGLLHRPTAVLCTGKDLLSGCQKRFGVTWRVLCGLASKSKRLSMKPAESQMRCAGMSSADAERPMCPLAYRVRSLQRRLQDMRLQSL